MKSKKRNILNTPRVSEFKKKKRAAMRKKILVWGFAGVLCLTGIIFLFRWNKINIQNIVVDGNTVIDSGDIKDIAGAEIAGNFLFAFPKSNFLLVPDRKIEEELSTKYKRLKDIKVETENTQTLKITASERTASYTWCGETPEAEEKCYFMDEEGYIFDEAPYFTGEVYFKFYGPVEDKDEDGPGGENFQKEDFKKLVSLKESLSEINLIPAAIYAENEDVKVLLSPDSSKRSPEILLKTDSEVEQIVENLAAALDTEPLKTDFKKKYGSLEYLDLRFGNKVYFKFR